MTKKICVVIGLIVVSFGALYVCEIAYNQTLWAHEAKIFSAVAMVVSAVLMLIACIKAYINDIKATTVLFGVASVLSFIGSIVFLNAMIASHYYHEMTDNDMCTFLMQNGPLIVLWIIYGLAKTPQKTEISKVSQSLIGTKVDVEVTDEDRKKYAEQVARCSMYELKVYVFDKKGMYDPALMALALEEIREREAGRRTRLTEEKS